MRCKDCGAEVPILREFCPNCGAPTDPSLRERQHQLGSGRQERRGERPKTRGKGLWIAAAALLGLGMAGNGLFNLDFGSTANDIPAVVTGDEQRGAMTIEADELFQAYRDDPEGSAELFRDREMVVSGEFVRIVPDGYGSLDLRLKTSTPGVEVGVDLADLAVEDGRSLRPGQRITVSCQQMGSGGEELWVQDCAIQPTAESGTAATATDDTR